MRRIFFTLLAIILFAVPVAAQTAALAGPEAVRKTAVVSRASSDPAPATAEEPKADKEVTVGEALADGADVVKGVQGFKSVKAKDGLYLAIMALLVVVFKFLLSAIKLSGPFWKGRKGKTVLRLTTFGLGAISFLLSTAMDAGWVNAITVGLAGPLAVAFHEYTVLIPTLSKKKDAAKADV